MVWFRVDDDLAFHRKVVAAGNSAMGLWVRSGSWCAQHLQDGFVPDEMIALIGTPAQRAKLIKVGLWIEVDGGCRFHQWNKDGRQPTAESVREKRAAAAERQARHRNGIFKNPQVNGTRNGVSSPLVTGVVTGAVTPPPTRPDPNQLQEELSLAPLAEPAPPAEPAVPDAFAEFWDAYPRRQDKRSAEKAWKAAIKRGARPDRVVTAARAYARQQVGNERRYIKLPATWLNADAYDNDPEPAQPLRLVSGGHQPYRNPTDQSVWDEPLLPPNPQEKS